MYFELYIHSLYTKFIAIKKYDIIIIIIII
jgi:hypothetical protein